MFSESTCIKVTATTVYDCLICWIWEGNTEMHRLLVQYTETSVVGNGKPHDYALFEKRCSNSTYKIFPISFKPVFQIIVFLFFLLYMHSRSKVIQHVLAFWRTDISHLVNVITCCIYLILLLTDI